MTATSVRRSIPSARLMPALVAGAIVAIAVLSLGSVEHFGPSTKALLIAVIAVVAIMVLVGALTNPALAAGLLGVVIFARVFTLAGSDRVAPGALAILLGAVALITSRRRDTPDALMLYIAMAGSYLALCALSSLWSTDPTQVLTMSRTLGLQMLVGVGVVACITNVRQLRWAMWGLIVSGFVIGLLAIRQYLSNDYSNDYLGLARASVEQIVGKKSAYRAGGPVGDANFFGQMMVVVIVAALERTRAAVYRSAQVFAALTVVVGIFTVIITYSRGTVIALVVGALLALAHSKHRGRAVLVSIVMVILALLVLPSGYTQRLSLISTVTSLGSSGSGQDDPAITGRSSSWIVATHMFARDPLAGVGFGSFEEHYLGYSQHVGLDTRGQNRNAHSFPLQILAEQGLLGFGLLVTVIIVAFRSVNGARRWFAQSVADHDVGSGSPLSREAEEAVSILGAVRDILIVYLIASVFLHAAYPQLFWFLLGLGFAARQCCQLNAPMRPAQVREPALT